MSIDNVPRTKEEKEAAKLKILETIFGPEVAAKMINKASGPQAVGGTPIGNIGPDPAFPRRCKDPNCKATHTPEFEAEFLAEGLHKSLFLNRSFIFAETEDQCEDILMQAIIILCDRDVIRGSARKKLIEVMSTPWLERAAPRILKDSGRTMTEEEIEAVKKEMAK